jgi:hypothetical protein
MLNQIGSRRNLTHTVWCSASVTQSNEMVSRDDLSQADPSSPARNLGGFCRAALFGFSFKVGHLTLLLNSQRARGEPKLLKIMTTVTETAQS